MNVKKTVRQRVDGAVSLDELRAFVDATADISGSALFCIEVERGQRDAEYYYLVVTETI